jgi:hypothetical protein
MHNWGRGEGFAQGPITFTTADTAPVRAALSQELRLRLEPVADDASESLAFRWPVLEAVFCQVVVFDAKRVCDDLGGAVAVVTVDRLHQKISYVTPHWLSLALPPILFGGRCGQGAWGVIAS